MNSFRRRRSPVTIISKLASGRQRGYNLKRRRASDGPGDSRYESLQSNEVGPVTELLEVTSKISPMNEASRKAQLPVAQPILSPLTRAAIFLVVCIKPDPAELCSPALAVC